MRTNWSSALVTLAILAVTIGAQAQTDSNENNQNTTTTGSGPLPSSRPSSPSFAASDDTASGPDDGGGLQNKVADEQPSPVLTAQSINAHNLYRGQYGAEDVIWADELWSDAQDWANDCHFQHSGVIYGENLFASTDLQSTCANAVNAWMSEAANYNYDTPGFNATTGHFTQVVWKSTKRIACGLAYCPEDTIFSNAPSNFCVCRYDPPGNVKGQYAENVGHTGTRPDGRADANTNGTNQTQVSGGNADSASTKKSSTSFSFADESGSKTNGTNSGNSTSSASTSSIANNTTSTDRNRTSAAKKDASAPSSNSTSPATDGSSDSGNTSSDSPSSDKAAATPSAGTTNTFAAGIGSSNASNSSDSSSSPNSTASAASADDDSGAGTNSTSGAGSDANSSAGGNATTGPSPSFFSAKFLGERRG